MIATMETDKTQPSRISGPHPTIAQLRDAQDPHVAAHIEECSMCRSVVAADVDDDPIPLDLPKGLVSENAFRWPPDPIARGGMAQIFAGEDRRLGRTVILKAPREDEHIPAPMLEMFQRRVTAEARVLAKLQHPAIVKIYELGKASVGWPFCVLERVDGVSLRDRLDELAELEVRDGRPRTQERLELLSNLVAIAEALAYAHERHVVHRDCTPNNILLGKRGEATLIDWGIARDLEAPGGAEPRLRDLHPGVSGSMVTITAGTPPYLPLEQSQGRRADPSFDVYSFGVTLYEVVSGRTPFDWRRATSPGGRTAQIEAYIAWLQSDDEVPPASPRDPELSGIIARAMHRDSARRFSADELVLALKQYLTGDLVFSHRYSVTGRLARWARRHRAVAVGMMSVALFAIAGALVWAQLSRAAREEADLRALAAQAQVNASEKARAADAANREAESARGLAEQAQREGKNADQLRKEADRKRRVADEMRHAAEVAAAHARGTAEDALKEKTDAMAERDAARVAQEAAEKQRDGARVAKDVADKQRDAAEHAKGLADADRDAARAAAAAADKERDAARAVEAAAEKERDAAIAARAQAERERDELRQKLAAAERELKARTPAPSADDQAPVTTPAP
jgi:tRNA A-37 threonylcarbamoyl transferase component Bud32